MTINNRIMAPVSKDQTLGMVQVHLDDSVIAQENLVALQGVNTGSIWRRVVDDALLYFE